MKPTPQFRCNFVVIVVTFRPFFGCAYGKPLSQNSKKFRLMKNQTSSAILLLLTWLALAQGIYAKPPSSDVNVVNTPSVNVANTPTVNIANTPTITLSGTPNVNIANTPTVNVGNFPSSQTISGTVQVGNDTAHPVPARDADNPDRNALQIPDFSFQIQPGAYSGTATATSVPAGKRLVIEYASGIVFCPAGQKIVRMNISAAAPNPAGIVGVTSAQLLPTFLGHSAVNNYDIYAVSQQIRLYADPGNGIDVGAYAERDGNTGSCTVIVSLTGHAIALP